MLEIRPAVRNDVDLLRTLIHEMGKYERLPVSITEETLARDGFGARPEFRVLIADLDNQPAGYILFQLLFHISRPRSIPGGSFCAPKVSGKESWRCDAFACCSRRSRRDVFRDHAECAGVESIRD
jgi:hypothetical protein